MKKVFLLIFFFQIIFFVVVPPFQIPDESGHYENVYWLSKGKYPYQLLEKGKIYPSYVSEMEKYYLGKNSYFSLTRIKNNPLKNKNLTDFEKKISPNFKPINFQSYHPFFYYLLLTPAQHLANVLKTDIISKFYLTRLLSSILYWLIFFFVYKILDLLKIKTDEKKTFLLFYCLNPLVLYYSIGINPDIGVAIFSTILLYLTIKFINKLSLINLFFIGIVAGLSYLSKTSGLITVLFITLIIIYKIYKERKGLRFLKKYLFFLFIFLITSSPWLYLHLNRYQTMTTPSFHICHFPPLKPNNFFKSIFLAAFEFRHTIMHYAGFFGSTNQFWPNKIYFVFYTITVIVFFLFGIKKNYQKFLILVFYLISSFVFFYALAFYFKKTGFRWDVQGRHFLLAFFPFYFFVFQGIKNVFGKKRLKIINFFSLINIFIFLFFLMIPSFYPNKNIVKELNLVYPNFGYIFLFSFLGSLPLFYFYFVFK